MEGEGEGKDIEKHFEGKEIREKCTHDVQKRKENINGNKKERDTYIPNTSSEYIHKVNQQ